MPDFLKGIRNELLEKARAVAELAGVVTVKYLQSYTEETRPALEHGDIRQAHPGHWGDVTFELMEGFESEVVPTENGWLIRLANTSEHASLVEAMVGYFVLEGVTDPGGPADMALKASIKALQPGWLRSAPDIDFEFDAIVATTKDYVSRAQDFTGPDDADF